MSPCPMGFWFRSRPSPCCPPAPGQRTPPDPTAGFQSGACCVEVERHGDDVAGDAQLRQIPGIDLAVVVQVGDHIGSVVVDAVVVQVGDLGDGQRGVNSLPCDRSPDDPGVPQFGLLRRPVGKRPGNGGTLVCPAGPVNWKAVNPVRWRLFAPPGKDNSMSTNQPLPSIPALSWRSGANTSIFTGLGAGLWSLAADRVMATGAAGWVDAVA